MLMTCIRTDQSTLDASVSHRFEVNALIGENITELNNRSSSLLKEAACKPAFFSINRRENNIASRTQNTLLAYNFHTLVCVRMYLEIQTSHREH